MVGDTHITSDMCAGYTYQRGTRITVTGGSSCRLILVVQLVLVILCPDSWFGMHRSRDGLF